jgi:hypothetical protein
VYPAKKFPGAIEYTPLSKTFARQRVKIFLRKEGFMRHVAKQAEHDADD